MLFYYNSIIFKSKLKTENDSLLSHIKFLEESLENFKKNFNQDQLVFSIFIYILIIITRKFNELNKIYSELEEKELIIVELKKKVI